MLHIGILGCGRIGQVHAMSLERLRDRARLVAVADAFEDAAEALAAKTGADVRAADALIASPDVDAIIIGTPTSTHYDIIHKAAAAGKAIFCEKPVDLSSERAAECAEVVSKAGVPFLTAFNRRFDPNFAHVEAELRKGTIGAIEQVIITSRDPGPPPIEYIPLSGGLFRDMMIHDFDMARFLLGEEPVSVYAVGSCMVDPEIGKAGDVDTAAVTMTTKSGAVCQITNSRRATYGYDQRIEIHGSKGMLSAKNQLENTVEHAGESGFTTSPAQHFFLERYAGAYVRELTHFLDAIESGSAPSPSAKDGLMAQRLADAATLSLAKGAPITI
ncbi:MAG: inositol 2-dehydrogenase [Pseudomonadota bacterium]